MNAGIKRLNKYNRSHQKTGLWITTDSTQWIELYHFSNGKLHGTYKRFRNNGVVAISGRYRKGIEVGKWRYYNITGQVTSWSKYRKGDVYKCKIGSISF
jgi:antitoxin component YwqK of YwqJK toxin-antitoxin module